MTEETNGSSSSTGKETNKPAEDEQHSSPLQENAEETSGENQPAAEQILSDIEKLEKQLEESEKVSNSYRDQLLRLAAEFENFRKRTDIEKAEFVKYSTEKMIRDLIPILDDFERALSNGKKKNEFESFYKGVDLIYQKLQKVFEEKGVKPIDSLGKEFDVNFHDVLMQIRRPDVPPHTVVEEVERGYTLHGKVIKHSKVIVAEDSGNNGEAGESH